MKGLDGLKEEIVAACRILDGKGLTEGFGHVSARSPDGSHILITPRRGLGLVTAAELLLVDPRGVAVQGPQDQLPLEAPLHLAIYEARPDVGAICRTHSFMAAVFGTLRRELLPVHGFGCFLRERVPVHPEPQLITNMEQGRDAAKSLSGHTALLLRGNGALTVGVNVRQACINAIFLEESAALQYFGSLAGQPIIFSGQEIASRSQAFENEYARAWDYYRTKYVGERVA